MDCIYIALFRLIGQSALQCCLSFSHSHTFSHTDGGRAAMQGTSLPVGSNSGFSAQGHVDRGIVPPTWGLMDDPGYLLSHSCPQYPEMITLQIKFSGCSEAKDKEIKTVSFCHLPNENFYFFPPQFPTLSTPLLSSLAPAVAVARPLINT